MATPTEVPFMLQDFSKAPAYTSMSALNNKFTSLYGYGALDNVTDTSNKPWFGGLFDNFFDRTDPNSKEKINGWGMSTAKIGTDVMNSWLGLKQYGLAKDQLAMNKDQFNRNFAAQANTTNAELADRQARRVLEDPRAQSVASYMAQYGVR